MDLLSVGSEHCVRDWEHMEAIKNTLYEAPHFDFREAGVAMLAWASWPTRFLLLVATVVLLAQQGFF